MGALLDSGTNPELIERNRTLEAENHLLRFKLNALLDMVSLLFDVNPIQ